MAKRPKQPKNEEKKARKDFWSYFFKPASDADTPEEGGFDLFAEGGEDTQDPEMEETQDALEQEASFAQQEMARASARPSLLSGLLGRAKEKPAEADEPYAEMPPLRAAAHGAAGTRIAYRPHARQAEEDTAPVPEEPTPAPETDGKSAAEAWSMQGDAAQESAFTEPPPEYTGEDLPPEYENLDGDEEEESVFTEPPPEYTGETVKPFSLASETEAPPVHLFEAESDALDAEEPVDEVSLFSDDAPEEEEEIQLFEEEDRSFRNGSTGRTRIVRTGAKTAARVQLNRTESQKRMEDEARKLRAAEAEEKHIRYLQKQKNKEKRKKALWQQAGNIAFTVFLIGSVLVALYYAFLLSDVVITGNEDYSDDYIFELSGLEMRKHILLIDLDEVEANIAEDPYLQVDSVTYIFPSRIRIAVTERKEVAGIIGLDYNVIIDHNGYVLSMGGGTDLSDLLQVTGISMTGFQLGERLGDGKDFGTATLISMIGKLEEYNLLDSVRSMDLTKPLAITMKAQNGLSIFVGQPTDLDGKMLSLYRELPQFIKQNISTGTLYLSAKGGTVYSQVDTAQLILDAELNPPAPDEGEDPDGTGDATGTGSGVPGTGSGAGTGTGVGAGTGTGSGTGTGGGSGTGAPDDFQG